MKIYIEVFMDFEMLFCVDMVIWNWFKLVKMWDMLGYVFKVYELLLKLKKKVVFKLFEIKRCMIF